MYGAARHNLAYYSDVFDIDMLPCLRVCHQRTGKRLFVVFTPQAFATSDVVSVIGLRRKLVVIVALSVDGSVAVITRAGLT
jgi:hypothetical protein